MDEAELIEVCRAVCDAVHDVLGGLDDWGLVGTRPGQYRSDLAADAVAVEILRTAGIGVLSEESGLHDEQRPLLAVLDPVDGSTNASQGLPWFATSICILDERGPLVACVTNQASGVRYEAVRNHGAEKNGVAIHASKKTAVRDAVVAFAGMPPGYLGWKQFRVFGAAALDLCCVAEGSLDAYLDVSHSADGPWDYLGGMLICTEAGAVLTERSDRELVVRDYLERRSPIAASTQALMGELRQSLHKAESRSTGHGS